MQKKAARGRGVAHDGNYCASEGEMTKRLKATINPAVLKWARTSASFSVGEVAQKLSVEEDVLSAWEAGADQPSIPKLRKLAELYKRPLAVLYLPEPPMSFLPMHDFRRLPGMGGGLYSPELSYEMRLAHQRRQLALDLLLEDGEKPPHFALKATIAGTAEKAGSAIRDALDLSYDLQTSWRETRVAFHGWRSRIEDLGVLVFQASRVDSTEASGFAHYADELPFIVVNRKDVWGRRTFSLLHELAHLMLHKSGVSDLDASGPRAPSDEQVEVFCNQVAAAALLPKEMFLSEPSVAGHPQGDLEWSDETIAALAKHYSVSRESIVRRLLTFGRTSEAFYGRKRQQYAEEYRARKQREKDNRGDKGIPRNMPRETVGDFGKPLVRRLLSHYHSERLSLAELSGFLGVKTRHVPGIEQTVVGTI